MAGLREKQRAERERRLARAAARRFRAAGYEATKIEEIAAEAEVSTGTVYNYYRHKGELLIAVVAMEVNEVLDEGEALVAAPPADAESAINRLVAIYLDHSLTYLSKDNWRHAMAAASAAPDEVFARRYADLDARLADQMSRLLMALQRAGALRADIDPALFGRLLFNNMNNRFVDYVKDEAMALDALKAELNAQHKALCALLR
ncbi:MAG: TetR/AcrR family transcriptional regulator [Alphaproteobacteria bacterium]|nr:TetR/AcrR family transcriptional regulator [Alphaproteobacteria bacterium]